MKMTVAKQQNRIITKQYFKVFIAYPQKRSRRVGTFFKIHKPGFDIFQIPGKKYQKSKRSRRVGTFFKIHKPGFDIFQIPGKN